jgi:heme exporter protein C
MKNAFILCAGITLVLLGYGTYQGLVVAPREETMGDAQRIFYYHVPAATAAYSLFFVNFAASIIYLWKRSTRADAWALAAAEVGLVFATVTLALGMIWARYAWGHWWAWDMRLTTFLILWLLYISYRMLRRSAEAGSTSVLAAALAVMVLSMSRSITWQTAGSAPTIPSQ